MVSYQKLKHVVGDKLLVEAVCLSTDTKPTKNIADSSKLTEQDTGKKYLFNSGTWYYIAEEASIEIEEPTLITLTEDTDVIGLATKAYNGEVLVQGLYSNEDAGSSLPSPMLLSLSPLVMPKTGDNKFIIVGFGTPFAYAVTGYFTDETLGPSMAPMMHMCVIASTPMAHLTKDDMTVVGVAGLPEGKFTYFAIEDFSENMFTPKFLITPLYSKQQQTHPATVVVPMYMEHQVTFYDGETGNFLTRVLLDDGQSISRSSIPVGYNYWTVDEVDEESITPHYSDEDIMNMSVDGDLTFYGWRESTIWLGDGATGHRLYEDQYVNGSVLPYNDIVNAVPRIAEYTHWFTDIDHNVPVDDITTEIIDGNTNYYGWVGDPNEKTGGE